MHLPGIFGTHVTQAYFTSHRKSETTEPTANEMDTLINSQRRISLTLICVWNRGSIGDIESPDRLKGQPGSTQPIRASIKV